MVLLVDDDPVFLEHAERTLVQAGMRVLTASSGRAALSAVRSIAEIKVVVLDLDLPDIPGMALIIDLRETRPDLKIVATTGVLSTNVLEIATYFGAETTLGKPITNDWIATINHVEPRAVRRAAHLAVDQQAKTLAPYKRERLQELS